MKLKLFILTALFAGVALAVGTSATVSWKLAPTYIDGTPLAASDIKETLIQWSRPGASTVAGSVRVTAPGTSVVVPNLVCGQFNFSATTIMNAAAQNSASADQNPPPYDTQVVCRANPPGALVVQ